MLDRFVDAVALGDQELEIGGGLRDVKDDLFLDRLAIPDVGVEDYVRARKKAFRKNVAFDVVFIGSHDPRFWLDQVKRDTWILRIAKNTHADNVERAVRGPVADLFCGANEIGRAHV